MRSEFSCFSPKTFVEIDRLSAVCCWSSCCFSLRQARKSLSLARAELRIGCRCTWKNEWGLLDITELFSKSDSEKDMMGFSVRFLLIVDQHNLPVIMLTPKSRHLWHIDLLTDRDTWVSLYVFELTVPQCFHGKGLESCGSACQHCVGNLYDAHVRCWIAFTRAFGVMICGAGRKQLAHVWG